MFQTQAIGRLTRDPKMATAPSGDTVANFDLACNPKKDTTVYLQCSVWGKRAEVIEQYCKKGSQLWVQGTVSVNEYDKRDGSRGYSLKFLVKDFTFCGSSKDKETSEDDNMNQKSDEVPQSVKNLNKDIEPEDNPLPEVDIDSIQVQMPF